MNSLFLKIFSMSILILSLSMIFVAGGVKNRLDTIIEGSDFTVIKEPVETRFIPKHDNLNVLIVAFKNPDLKSRDLFYLNVLGEKDEILRRMEFSGQNMRDPSDIRFQFEPIPSVAGKQLGLRVEHKAQAGENPVSVAISKDKNIAFASYYRGAGNSVISDLVGKIRSDMAFFAVWAGILSLILWKGIRA